MAEKNATIANLDINVRAKLEQLAKLGTQGAAYLTSFATKGIHALEKLAHGAESIAHKVVHSLAHIGSHAAGVFAGLVGFKGFEAILDGLKEMTVGQFEAIVSTEHLAQELGVEANVLRALQLAGERVGIEHEKIAMAMVRSADAVGNFLNGSQEAAKTFDELKLSAEGLRNLDPAQQFLAIVEALQKMGSANDRIRLARDIFGRGGAEMLRLTRQGFDDASASASKFGLMIGHDAAQGAEELHKQLVDLGARMHGIATQLVTGAAPAITSWIEALGEQLDKLGSRTVAQKILDGFLSIRNSVMDMAEGFINSFGGIEGSLLSLQKSLLITEQTVNALSSGDTWADIGKRTLRWGAAPATGGLSLLAPQGSPSGDNPAAQKIENILFSINQRIGQLGTGDFHFPGALRTPIVLPPEAPPLVTPPGVAARAAIPGFSAIIATLPNAIEKAVKGMVPQSFGTPGRGTVEATRAIFEAARGAAEAKANEGLQLQREGNAKLDRIAAAVEDNNLDVADDL